VAVIEAWGGDSRVSTGLAHGAFRVTCSDSFGVLSFPGVSIDHKIRAKQKKTANKDLAEKNKGMPGHGKGWVRRGITHIKRAPDGIRRIARVAGSGICLVANRITVKDDSMRTQAGNRRRRAALMQPNVNVPEAARYHHQDHDEGKENDSNKMPLPK
jgi:hypothetical protein